MMHGKITYHQQVTYCGKPRCRRCREGIGHGPYWYAYQNVNGHTLRTYIGKHLPTDLQSTPLEPSRSHADSAITDAITGEDAMVSHYPAPPARISQAIVSEDSEKLALRVRTLGSFQLERRVQRNAARGRSQSQSEPQALRWQVVNTTIWQKQKAVRDLISYLICCPERKASRGQIVAALWPEQNYETANSTLTRAVAGARKVLGHASVQQGQVSQAAVCERLRSEGDWLIMADAQSIWIDADEFEERVAFLEHEGALSSAYEAMLRKTIDLYHGDFLPEERSAEWVALRRQMLRRRHIDVLLMQAVLSIEQSEYANAIQMLNVILSLDPTNELAIQNLMVALMRQQRRPEAIDAYKRFAQKLGQEYQAMPAAETQAIYEALRSGTLETTSFKHASLDTTEGQSLSTIDDSTDLFTVPHGFEAEFIGRANQSTLVGREFEMSVMRAMLHDVLQSSRLQAVGARQMTGIPLDTQRQPQLLLLKGDIGIGKTRLAEELGREAKRDGWVVVWNLSYSQESGIPYRGWMDALRKLLLETDVLDRLSHEAIQVLSTLPGLLDVLPLDVIMSAQPLHTLLPEHAQFRLHSVINDLLRMASEDAPLLIVLDDVQWADASSHQLLGHLARQLSGYPVVFLSTCRDSELPRDPHHPLQKLILDMHREHTIKTLDIEPLSQEQIGQLIASLSSLPEKTIKDIQMRSAGNPLFAEEMARLLPQTPLQSLPATILDAMANRTKCLTSECRDLLRLASVLGGSFEFSLLCMMKTDLRSDNDDDVLDWLEEAQDAGLVDDKDPGRSIIYHFWHPLLVSYLYNSVSAVRRALWHKKAANAILRLHEGHEEEVAAMVTHHLEGAGAEPLLIAQYSEMAGDYASALPAYLDAVNHYQRAVEYLEKAKPDNGQAHLISLLERLAECTKNSGSYEKASEIFQRLLELRDRQSSSAGASSVDAKSEAQIQALLWEEICWIWRYRGDSRSAWECCERGVQILERAGVTGGPAWARLYYTQSNLYLLEGKYDQAQRYAQDALRLFEEQQATSEQAVAAARGTDKTRKTMIQRTLDGDPVNLCRLHRHLGVIAAGRGQLRLALGHQLQALETFERYNERRQTGNLLSNIGYIHLKLGDYEQARQALQRALQLAKNIDDGPLASLVLSNLGGLDAATGQLDDAVNKYQRALERAFGDNEYMSRWHTELAEILLRQGKQQEAIDHLKRALLIARTMKIDPCLGQTLVAIANVRIMQALKEDPGRRRDHLLLLAQKNVKRALGFKIEAETRMKGQLAQGQIALERVAHEEARAMLRSLLTEAQDYAQIVERARQLLASIQ